MWKTFPLFPDSASNLSVGVDTVYAFLLVFSVFFSVLIFTTIFVFALKYHRSRHPHPTAIEGSLPLELAWSIGPFIIIVGVFFYGTQLYFQSYTPQPDAMEIFVVGKQWMWKLQHPEGAREINELHVPVGRMLKFSAISEDVIHSFYIPAFRVKRDVLPGRYQTMWVKPTKPGKYHLFCAEYCGAQHSGMIGWVYVMEPAEYEKWLSGGGEISMATRGQKLFEQYGCASCHRKDERGRGPSLEGVYGKPVKLSNGQTVIADDAYLRESILHPQAKIVYGFGPIMPSFQGQLGEEQLLQIITYIKSLQKPERSEPQQ
jgi:cytochrome c oxidase subunit II